MSKKWGCWVVACICFFGVLIPGRADAAGIDYRDRYNWSYYGNEAGPILAVDVFFVGPTVFMGNDVQFTMPLDDPKVRSIFRGAINMEKGIYDSQGNFYAPYYRQAGLNVYKMEPRLAAPYFELAYMDVKAAFDHYLKEANHQRPIILAGFSQGADMIVRLMKEKFQDPALQDKLVAAYVIGWRVTQDEIAQYPYLRMAKGEYDTGVIISFNTEAPEVVSSLTVPGNTLGINPLNWKTTGEHADKSLNRGAVFTRYDGSIIKEIPNLTGAYLDQTRGTVKVTDIDAAEFPPILDLFKTGEYHIYDYQFFYRNLQQNVKDRMDVFQRWNNVKKAS